jgi:speckle-type POZ protein
MGSEFYLFDVEYDQAKRATIGTAMYSAALSTGGHSWRVNLYPCGRDVADNGAFMSIYLEHLSKSVTNSVNAFFEVSLMDKNGQSFRAGARSGVILFHKQEWGWPQLISLTDVERNYITQGRFRFMCAITVISDNSIRVPPPDLGKQLGLLLECTEGTDVSFIIAGETFRAHRAVLAARSPVFRASLLGTMAEATMPSITIRGITAQVFRIMLQFIYTDAFPGDDELGDSPFRMLVCLLAASGRYALDRLKVWCASKLWDRVAAKTVSITLLVADTYSCLELKERCIEFMLRNDAASSIYLTDGFVQLIRKCPHLVEELQGRRGM